MPHFGVLPREALFVHLGVQKAQLCANAEIRDGEVNNQVEQNVLVIAILRGCLQINLVKAKRNKVHYIAYV